MEHRTWTIPTERQRPRSEQSRDDLRHTLWLWWQYLIGPFVPPPRPLTRPSGRDRPPVLIVPGFICRPAIYAPMQRALHDAGFDVHILDFGFQVGNLFDKAEALSRYIDGLGVERVHVVAHSMGGLIVTACQYLGETRIAHGWTLGAPLAGTRIVYLVYLAALLILLLGAGQGPGLHWLAAGVFLSPGLAQMRPGSDLLRVTSRLYPQMENLTAVFCQHDLIVFLDPRDEPGSASRFGRPDDVLFPEVGHNNIAMGGNAIACLVAELVERDRDAGD